MKITKSNLSSWMAVDIGNSPLIVDSKFNDEEFSEFLVRMKAQLGDLPSNQTVLIFRYPLTTAQYAAITKFINQNANSLPFSRLTLMDAAVDDPGFSSFAEALNNTSIQRLKLTLPEDSKKEIEILTKVAEKISYPVIVTSKGKRSDANNEANKEFEGKIIENMQRKNFARLVGAEKKLEPGAEIQAQIVEQEDIDPHAKKIKLKELIRGQLDQDDYDQYIKLEVQHVEVSQVDFAQIEQFREVAEQEQFEQEQEQEQVEQEQEQGKYAGKLIGYREFEEDYSGFVDDQLEGEADHLCAIVEKQLFGNLPKAIKFLTPDAAEVIATNLSKVLTFNADNLPQNFILKKTDKGELVLDYDLYAPERKGNVFTPKIVTFQNEHGPIYSVKISQESKNEWIFDEDYISRLDNMWIKYGDKGVKYFFDALKKCDESHTGLSEYLFNHYLFYFKQWDHFLDNKNFLISLDKIKKYDEAKLACLKKFLDTTGLSRHDLSTTLEGFEEFWKQWEKISKDNEININEINKKWTTPEGGNPLVYMERLLTILRNARDVKDQVACLDGIILDNYGAYYASKYEGFKIVSSEMEFKYNSTKQNKIPFNPDASVYRVELEDMDFVNEEWRYSEFYRNNASKLWLIECGDDEISSEKFEKLKNEGKIIPYDEKLFNPPHRLYLYDDQNNNYIKKANSKPRIYKLAETIIYAYRFIGEQQKAIPVKEYVNGFNDYLKNYGSSLDSSNMRVVFTSLLFLAHGNYSGNENLVKFLDEISKMGSWDRIISNVNRNLIKLFQMDIRMDPKEGRMIFKLMAGMDSNKYKNLELKHENYEKYIKKFFNQLETNPHAMLKLIKLSIDPNWPYIFALDTAAFLAKNERIAQAYQDDLLLFSRLINGIKEEAYFEDRNDKYSSKIKLNLEKVQNYLAQAATAIDGVPNNFDYALKILISSRKAFTYKAFLQAFEKIGDLKQIDNNAVDEILKLHNFSLDMEQPEIVIRSGGTVKRLMAEILLMLRKDIYSLPTKSNEYGIWQKEIKELLQQNTQEIQAELQEAWKKKGIVWSVLGKAALAPRLEQIKTHAITDEFSILRDGSPSAIQIKNKIHALKDFSDGSSFEKIDRIAKKAETLAELFSQIMERENFQSHEEAFAKLFERIDFLSFEHKSLSSLLSLLVIMPQRDYLGILTAFFDNNKIEKNTDNYLKLIGIIKKLHINSIPSSYIEKIVTLVSKSNFGKIDLILNQINQIKDKEDTLLKWMLTGASLSVDDLLQVATLTRSCEHYRDQIQKLFQNLHAKPSRLKDFLDQIGTQDESQRIKILEIIARSDAVVSKKTRGAVDINYVDLVKKINDLGSDRVESLYKFFESTTVSVPVLYNGLNTRNTKEEFDVFLSNFEIAPFGVRILESQFDIKHVERVVNSFKDLNNDSAYTFLYRKQMMESFLFINRAGNDLPVYRNKPAKDLTNQEIQELFQAIKSKSDEFKHLDDFQRRLYALGLMREAMYRATGQFPYSTQMLGLIDCMMHQGDVIANIDTGQGKSLIDTMKAALLWLDSDRVDLTTSSMVDAKRDIEIYSPFFSLIGISHSKSPVSSSSSVKDYKTNGINYSTMSQLALFYAKAKGEGVAIGTPDDSVSLVMNESDHTILDDKTIYRYATTSHAGVGTGNEWIYTAINDFVQSSSKFKENKTSAKQDIALLRNYLEQKAKENKPSSKIINKFTDDQLLTWIESALLVNYHLREKYDYVVTDPEERLIDGVNRSIRVAKILMKDGKVNPDTQYGNGMQQLLHAKLNVQYGPDSFIIEPESKTLISLNNRNMIDYYRSKKGYIWGSSGTVGSVGRDKEIEIQYLKYGFEFSKVEPHQEKKVKVKTAKIAEDEEAQFELLFNQIQKNNQKRDKNKRPSLVFLKDIETAERFYKYLKDKLGKDFKEKSAQLYTGLGNEEQVIQNAATLGMITVTTSALGRNTDIPYDRDIGMDVYHGFLGPTREFEQRSGRTGRQGSEGSIYTILSQQDYPGLTIEKIEEVQKKFEATAERERQFNEELYNILGYFLQHLEASAVPKEFYSSTWATFSEKVETQYRQQKSDNSYLTDSFVKTVVEQFNQLPEKGLANDLTKDEVIEYLSYSHPGKQNVVAYQGPVKVADCTPPDLIAYHFLNKDEKVPQTKVNEEEIKGKLKQLFAAVTKKSFYSANKDYISYLNAEAAGINDIREIHQRALSEFLTEQSKASQKFWFFKRWFKFEGHLNKIVSNENYLLMFKAISDVRGENPSDDAMKKAIQLSIKTLLKEYLQSIWYKSPDKKTAARNLIAEIDGAKTLDTIILAVQKAKKDIGEADINTNVNQASFLRRHKPLHSKGFSRLQSTLDKALELTASLTHKKIESTFVDTLNWQLKSLVVVNDGEISQSPLSKLTFDSFKAEKSFEYKDKHNAQVVAKSLEVALKQNMQLESPAGMAGRFALFQPTENKKQDKVFGGEHVLKRSKS